MPTTLWRGEGVHADEVNAVEMQAFESVIRDASRRRVRRTRQGKFYGDGQSATRRVFEEESSTQQLRESRRHREVESGVELGPAQSIKRREYRLTKRHGHARTAVDHEQFDEIADDARLDGDRFVDRSESARVAHDVGDDTFDQDGIGEYRWH